MKRFLKITGDPSYTICRVGNSPYQLLEESATPRIFDSGESIFDYEYLHEFEAKITKALTAV